MANRPILAGIHPKTLSEHSVLSPNLRGRSMRALSFALAVLAAIGSSGAIGAESKIEIGKKVADFALNDFRGQAVSLNQAGKDKAVVLVFLGTECPLCKLYAPRLAELAKQYEPKGVVFLGIDSNRQDSVTENASYARNHNHEFPILKDPNPGVADQACATSH